MYNMTKLCNPQSLSIFQFKADIINFKMTPRLSRHYPIKNYRCCTPTFNYGGQLFLYVSHMLRVNMTRDLAHISCLIYREKLDLYAELLVYREKDGLYAKRNGYYLY